MSKEFQMRVVKEKEELDGKIEKLRTFTGSETYKKLPDLDQYLLTKQYSLMINYSNVLKQRIERFNAR